MSEIDPDTLEKFLEELTKLTQKYGIEISGCGCCGSPSLYKIKERTLQDTEFVLDSGYYEVDEVNDNLRFAHFVVEYAQKFADNRWIGMM